MNHGGVGDKVNRFQDIAHFGLMGHNSKVNGGHLAFFTGFFGAGNGRLNGLGDGNIVVRHNSGDITQGSGLVR